MLVYFHRGFLMEGESSFKKYQHFWKKPTLEKRKIYLFAGVSGICDESEVEVERLTKERLKKSSGWGENFAGWQRTVPYREALKICLTKGWDAKHVPKDETTIEYINAWKMNKIVEQLTGEQFALFCKEQGILYKDGGFNV